MATSSGHGGSDKLSYSWPAAAGLGLLTFFGTIGVGNYSDLGGAALSLIVIIAFGFTFEWAFYNRDPVEQIEHGLKPKLMTYDEVFGPMRLGIDGPMHAINAAFMPREMKSYDAMFGWRAKDLGGLKRSIEAFGPKSLTSYGALFGHARRRA